MELCRFFCLMLSDIEGIDQMASSCSLKRNSLSVSCLEEICHNTSMLCYCGYHDQQRSSLCLLGAERTLELFGFLKYL